MKKKKGYAVIWEYKLLNLAQRKNLSWSTEETRKKIEDDLNRLGDEGWEAVNFDGEFAVVLFKRPLKVSDDSPKNRWTCKCGQTNDGERITCLKCKEIKP